MATDYDRSWYDTDEGGLSSRAFDSEYAFELKEEEKYRAKEEKYKQDQSKLVW